MRISEASQQFLSQRRSEGYSPYTISAYSVQIRLLARDIGDKDIEAVTLQTMREHLAKQTHLKPASLGHKVRALRAFFAWLTEEELLPRNPMSKIKEPKQPDRVPKALTMDELEALRDSCKTTMEHALVEVFFATGARVGEIHRLNKGAIDFDRHAVVVLGKGSKERECYFGAKAAIWLRRYLSERKDSEAALFVTQRKPYRRLSIHETQYIFKRIANRCGLRNRVSPHVMRHTFATLLLNQDAPITVVQTLCGHAKPETTMLYARLSGENRKRAYDRYFVQ